MNAGEESFELDAAETVVLNALVDLHADETIVLDEDSARRLGEAVDAATTSDERSAFRDDLDRLLDLETGEHDDMKPELHRYVTDVTEELTERGYSLSVSHEDRQEISPLDASVYTFIRSLDVGALEPLELTDAVEAALEEGAELLDADDVEDACSAFEEAVDSASGRTERAASRVVAAWGYFRAGDDDTALDYVHEALELEESSWAAKIVGASVTRDEGDAIRSGVKSVGLVLRWSELGTENTSTRAEIGTRSDEDEITWSEVEHLGGHAILDRVYPETWIRFKLTGELPDFPIFQMYYLGVGLYDVQMDLVEKVYHRLESGPARAGTVERISIYR